MPHPTPTLSMCPNNQKITSCHGCAAVGVQLQGGHFGWQFTAIHRDISPHHRHLQFFSLRISYWKVTLWGSMNLRLSSIVRLGDPFCRIQRNPEIRTKLCFQTLKKFEQRTKKTRNKITISIRLQKDTYLSQVMIFPRFFDTKKINTKLWVAWFWWVEKSVGFLIICWVFEWHLWSWESDKRSHRWLEFPHVFFWERRIDSIRIHLSIFQLPLC